MIDPFYGPRPVVGDKVYVDFGDGIDGGEITGTVLSIAVDGFMRVKASGAVEGFYPEREALHIEVVQ